MQPAPPGTDPSRPRSQWLAMDTGSVRNIIGVVTQGRGWDSANGDKRQMVNSYTVSVSDDDKVTWKDVDAGKIFTGNVVGEGADTKVQNNFAAPVQARYVRIHPVSWNGAIAMRAGVYLEGTC